MRSCLFCHMTYTSSGSYSNFLGSPILTEDPFQDLFNQFLKDQPPASSPASFRLQQGAPTAGTPLGWSTGSGSRQPTVANLYTRKGPEKLVLEKAIVLQVSPSQSSELSPESGKQ